MWRYLAASSLCALLGCGSSEAPATIEPTGSGGGAAGCNLGERWVEARGCVAAGIQDNGCPAGEVGLPDGGCAAAGIAPEDCAPGFSADEDGCRPILPSEPCPPGLMAVPGETRCREVAPCGAGNWGDIPVESNTQYVDAAYLGGDSDGTSGKPWTTIQNGVLAAEDGAIVAIAAGSYAGSVLVLGKSLRLWGRCPALVEIVGAELNAAVFITNGSSSVEVRDLAITGESFGIHALGTDNHSIDRVWIHDTADRGIVVQSAVALATGLSLTRSLIERVTAAGIVTAGGSLRVERSVVRGTHSDTTGYYGDGIDVLGGDTYGPRASLELRDSVVRENRYESIFIYGSDAHIEATVVSDTLPGLDDGRGSGITANANPAGERSNLVLLGSVLERNRYGGVGVRGSDARIETTVVRDTAPQVSDSQFGYGITYDYDYDDTDGSIDENRAQGTIRSCVVAGNQAGIFVDSADASIESTVVRSNFDRGINVDDYGHGASDVTITSSAFAENRESGVLIGASLARLEGVLVRDTLPIAEGTVTDGVGMITSSSEVSVAASVFEGNEDDQLFISGSNAVVESSHVGPGPAHGDGEGIHLQGAVDGRRAALQLRDSIVEASTQDGLLVIAADAAVERTWIRDTRDLLGTFGDGIAVASRFDIHPDPASARIVDTLVERSVRGGIATFGAPVVLEDVTLQCNTMHLVAEVFMNAPGSFEAIGETSCGCETEPETCKALSAGLTPPEP